MQQIVGLCPSRLAVAHRKFQRPQIRRIQPRVIHLGQNSTFQGEPYMRLSGSRRTDGLFASRRPRRHRPRPSGRILRRTTRREGQRNDSNSKQPFFGKQGHTLSRRFQV